MDYKVDLTPDERVKLRSSIVDSLFPKFDSELKIVYKKCDKEIKSSIEQLQSAIEESCKIHKIKKL